MHRKKAVILIIAAVITAVLFGACTQEGEQITSFSQLKEKGTILAVSTDTPEAEQILKDFPDAESVSILLKETTIWHLRC